MKKFIKNNIVGFILGAVIFTGITSVAAYTIFANDIGYTPKDTTWKKSNGEDITNVEDAIDDLYSKMNGDKNIKLLNFNNEYVYSSYNVSPSVFDNTAGNSGWHHSKSSINYNFTSNTNFEISVDVFYQNNAANMMGGFSINFYNNDKLNGTIIISDSWANILKNQVSASLNNKELYNVQNTSIDLSGRYSIFRKDGTLYFYLDNNLLNSIDFDESVEFDRIEIDFKKYPNYDFVNTYIKNIYIGDIINY